MKGLLDGFVEGDRLTVGWDPFKKGTAAIMARVDPTEEEVWDFRCLDPNPGMRAFGSFAERDTFIALTWDYRENVDDWSDKVAECKTEWEKLFCNLTPHKGKKLDDYLSYNVCAV